MHLFSASVTIRSSGLPLRWVVIELSPHGSIREAVDAAYHFSNTQLGLADAVVVRPPVDAPLADTDIISLANDVSAFQRLPSKPVYVLYSRDFAHRLSSNINQRNIKSPIISDDDKTHAIADIRRAELDHLVDIGRAKMPKLPGVVYEAPSGKHMRSFLRVGNVQRNRAAADAVFFWLLPYLRQCGAIITDTWSISTIAMNVSRRLSTYEAQAFLCPVEMLDSYLDQSPAKLVVASELVHSLVRSIQARGDSQHAKVLVLISATHTGSVAASLRQCMEDMGLSSTLVDFVALFRLSSEAAFVPAVRDYSPSEHTDFDEPAGTKKVDVIKIDPQLLFPAEYREEYLKVRPNNARIIREILQKYDCNIVRLHKDTDHDGRHRHHAIWLDTPTLTNSPLFRRAFSELVKKLVPRPVLIVAPPHVAATNLAKLAQDELEQICGFAPPLIVHPSLLFDRAEDEQAARKQIEAIGEGGAILVVDDSYVVGSRVQNYLTHLRRFDLRCPVHFLIGVARPERIGDWNDRVRMLSSPASAASATSGNNSLQAVEIVALPNWAEDQCPWCEELRIYEDIEINSGEALSKVTSQRRAYLQVARKDGIIDGAFLVEKGVGKLSFTKNSVFHRIGGSEAHVFCAVAAAIHELRHPITDGDLPLAHLHFPVSTTIDPGRYLSHTYSDSLLRACFLRGAKAFELVCTDPVMEQRRMVAAGDIISSSIPTTLDLIPELLLARAEGKINIPAVTAVPATTASALKQQFPELWADYHPALITKSSAASEATGR